MGHGGHGGHGGGSGKQGYTGFSGYTGYWNGSGGGGQFTLNSTIGAGMLHEMAHTGITGTGMTWAQHWLLYRGNLGLYLDMVVFLPSHVVSSYLRCLDRVIGGEKHDSVPSTRIGIDINRPRIKL